MGTLYHNNHYHHNHNTYHKHIPRITMSTERISHPAGALDGLNLGAPIGGGSTSSFPAHPATTTTTGGSTGTHGLTGSSGLSGPHDHSHRDNQGESHRTAVGAAASNATDKYDTSARNTTSGDKGIGGGHGGPTAFESDASRVGTDRTGDHHHHSSTSGLTGDRTGDRGVNAAGVKAALAPGHHDSSSRDGKYEQTNVGSGLGHNHESSSHTGRNLAAGAGATGVASAVVADVGARDHTSGYEGIVNDSITGQTHFAPGQSTGTTGVATGARSTGLATGAGVGAGAAGLAGVGAGAGHSKKESLSEKMTGKGHHDNGPIDELKQELKEHQKSGSGYDVADKHPESKGPHGLVWHNGKYVHQRELDGHGSTGVPLK